MAVTHMTLLMLGTVAMIGSSFAVLNVSRDVRVAGMFVGSLLWALMSISSFDVAAQAFTEPQPVYPLVYLGAAMSIAIGMLSLYHLSLLLGEETGATDADGILPDSQR